MKRRGFTLIELLAVIIVLAIIALIATPIILNVIDDVRKEANFQTAVAVLNGAKNYYAESWLDDSKKSNLDGKTNVFDDLVIENKPQSGQVYITEDGKISVLVTIGNTSYVKQFGTSTFEEKPSDEDIFVGIDENVPTVDIEINTSTGVTGNTWYTEAPTIDILPKDEETGVDHFVWCQGIDCTPNIMGTKDPITITDSKETQICVIVYDKAGNASEKKCTDKIMVDTQAPEFSGIADITVGVNEEVDLITGVEVTDATSGVNGTFSTNPTSVDTKTTGTKEVVYTVFDNAGNKAEITRKVIVSASAPTITYEVAEGIINEHGWAKSNFFVTIKVTDNTGHGLKEFKICTSPTDTCEPSIGSVITDSTTATREIVTEGSNNRICVQATDKTEQTSEIICSDAYKLDKTDPVAGTINITGTKGENDWYTTDVTVTTNEGSDTLSGHLSTVVDIESIKTNTEGTIVTVTTKDKAGNTATNEYTIKVDKTIPSASINKTVVENQNVLTGTINPSTTESEYTYQWYKDGSKITNATSISYTTSESGIYKLEVTTGSGKVINSNEITINSYTVSYNLNGGTGSISNTTKIEDLSTNITTSVPTRTGYEFMGWGLTATDKTKTYSSNDAYTANENKGLYAIWKKTLTATFVANGASLSGETTPTCDIYNAETICNVTAPTITKSGFSIVGFGTSSDAQTSVVGSGKTASISEDTTYYAVTSKEVTVTFNRNGAASITPLNGSASTSSSITQKCIIWNTATTCSITSPTITASSNTPSVVGWDSTSSYTSNEWSANTAKEFSGNASYYAVTMKNAVTHTITYAKDTGVDSIGATSGSCNIAATYNGNAQTGSCSVTLPTIAASTGYTVSGWYNSSGTKLGNATASISVSATQTITAKATINSYPCSAGYYLGASATSCTQCEAGSYCPGGTYTYSSSTQGKSTCPSIYTNSAAGSNEASDCYVTTSAGKYIASANATSQTACQSGYYCPSTTIYYGSTGGRNSCPSGYGNSATSSDTENDCYLITLPGKYIRTPKTSSLYDCPAGSFCEKTTIYYGMAKGPQNCPSSHPNSPKNSAYSSSCYKTITVTYAGNGATGGSTESSSCKAYYNNSSCSITLNSNGFSKTNYEFQGWGTSTSTVTHNAGSSYSFSGNTTLNAIWKSNTNYAFGTPTTSSPTNFQDVITESGSKVFTKLENGVVSICIYINNNIECFKNSFSEEADHLLNVFNTNGGGCNYGSSSIYCNGNNLTCNITSTNNSMYCRDDASYNGCEMDSNNNLTCQNYGW